jgi:ATP-dependent DNA helicase RecG
MHAGDAAITLQSGVTALPGVADRVAASLRSLGIRTVADLVRHLPIRYEQDLGERTAEEARASAREDGVVGEMSARGMITAVRHIPGRRPRVEATLEDESGSVRLVWFNAPWIARRLRPGLRGVAQGKAKSRAGYVEMSNPRWRDEAPSEGDAPIAGRLRPVYAATEELSSLRIESFVKAALPHALPSIDDPVRAEIVARRGLPTLAEAYRMVHLPADAAEAERGRARLAFDELLLLQLGLAMRRWQARHQERAHALPRTDSIHAAIVGRFPFTFTPDQLSVCDEIAHDLAGTAPMNRLVQGDVGSGKTAVALYAALLAIAHGHQAVIVAPTELLAEQHYRNVVSLMRDSRVRCRLVTGSLPARERAEANAALAGGQVDLAIGTHALLGEGVQFRSLALAVIDEQHRFGVEQRAALRAKGDGHMPHMLVMTATPIPRTLSLTLFGDLDVSSIRALPPGRQPIATRVMPRSRSDEVYAYARTRIDRGEQVYVVVPAVEESDQGLADVAGHAAALATGPFAGLAIGQMHGRLTAVERDAVMGAFKDGRTQILVSTVVIEVGVDVPNATVMIVEHAERFGLAQLHQLRGRVGRGSKASLCVLIGDPTADDGERRLRAMAGTTDGFEIAEEDLKLRGPGEFFGTRQSGLPPLRVADLTRDTALLLAARDEAQRAIDASPTLADPTDARLRRKLMSTYGDALGLADVG